MIKRAQIKFICITMTILFVVFFFIFIANTHIVYNANEHTIEQTLNDTAKSFYLTDSEEGFIHSNAIICKISKNDYPQNFSTNIWFDSDVFNAEKANIIVNNILENNYSTGRLNNVYYKIFPTDNEYLLVAIDASDTILSSKSTTLSVFLIFLIIYSILFVTVTSLSFYVFKPIKDAFRKQKQFVSNASHELRTPLAIISANADVLKQDDNNQWIDNIKSQTARMNILVEDMLTLAKIDEGKTSVSREKFVISDEILGNALPFDALAFEKGKTLIINVQPSITYTGNKICVNQVLNILLDNAVKHASENGEIIVDFHKEKGRPVLTVSNTGSNVPANQANKVFERFYRGDNSRARETGGSGLGLSIAKSVCDANKWKISAQSVLNECMTITVIF